MADKWCIQNAWTLALIIYNTKNPIGLGISMLDTAAVAWKTLKTMYAAVSDLAAAATEGALRRMYYSDSSSFPDYIKDLRTKWNLVLEKGTNVKDKHFCAIVIASLSKSWDTIVATVQGVDTSAETIAGLTVHWERLCNESKECSASLH
ncbi:hypothetical protein C0991_008593 [Blastosporella zonata]|nr:hypothetical protein C0991_008593 [Blastosporella zonata]